MGANREVDLSLPHTFKHNGIQAILFDLDGTLRHNDPSAVDVFLEHAAKLGVGDSRAKRRKYERWVHYYWAQSPDLLEDRQLLEDEDKFWTHYAWRSLQVYGCSPGEAQALAAQMHAYMKEFYQPKDCVPDDVPATLEGLKARGFRLGVLSNRTKPYGEQMLSLGLADYFEFALAAGDFEVWKPDPGLFLHALERMQLHPEQAIYVGDNYYADVIGARGAGVLPVLLDPQGIFPGAGCPVIQSIGELGRVLADQHPKD